MQAYWAERPILGHVNTKVTEVTDQGVKVVCEDGKEILFDADTVIYCVGLRADTSVTEEMKKYCYDVVPVGDCVRSGRIVDAVETGYHAAIDLA